LGTHGFLREPNGTFIKFDVPDASTTGGISINPAGVITGQYFAAKDPSDISHGFVREPDGAITTFDAPGAGMGTYPMSINPAGMPQVPSTQAL